MKLIPLEQAARALGLSVYTLRKESKNGKLPYTFIGGRYMYHMDALEAAITEQMLRNGKSSGGDRNVRNSRI